MRDVVFTQAARAELIAAQAWYEAEASGLGRRFRLEVDRVVSRLAAAPLQFPVVFKTVRRARVKSFPYALLFVLADETPLVVACFHSSRDPQHWQKRR